MYSDCFLGCNKGNPPDPHCVGEGFPAPCVDDEV